MQSIIINHILTHWPWYGVLTTVLAIAIYKFLNSNFYIQKQRKKYQKIFKTQQHQIKSQQGLHNKFYQNISDITKQNNQYTAFLKDSILQQFATVNAKYDILQRYIISINKKVQKCGQSICSMQTKMNKPFLQKNIAKWLIQTIMDNHISKKIDYLRNVKSKFKQTVKQKDLLDEIYRVFKQITRQQVQLMSNFVCNYGDFSKPLKQILQTRAFQKFIYVQIAECIKLQTTEQIIDASIKIMQKYKEQMITYIERS